MPLTGIPIRSWRSARKPSYDRTYSRQYCSSPSSASGRYFRLHDYGKDDEVFINKAVGKRTLRKPRISVCIPSGATEVEKKAVEDATYQAGAREVAIIEEPVAAAIGAGIDIGKACGNMIVDIGGGTQISL